MRVTILGSGTAVPSATHFPPGVLVEAGNEVVLVDVGPGVLRRLAAAGKMPDQVTTVALTHYHPDHCADLVALLFALRNPAFAGRPPLRILGGGGLHDLLRALRTAWPRWLEAGDYELEEREIGPGLVPLGGVDMTAFAMRHTAASLAYRFREESSGAVATVSGDADALDGLADAARDADVFVCEAAFPATHPSPRHLSAADAGQAAQDAGARLLCLTHLYPREWAGHDPIAEARTTFSGRVIVAEDLLRLSVTSPEDGIDVTEPRYRS